MAKWLDLLKTGKWKDRHNIERTITSDLLSSIAKNFVSGLPITVGHPGKEKVPQFGIMDKVRVLGDKLQWLPDRVVPEFASLVRQGGFPDLSAGLNEAMDRLTHVAFLSAEKPAIDGLTPVAEFSSDQPDDKVICITVTELVKNDLPEFASSIESYLNNRINDVGRALRNFKNYLIDKEGQEKADQVIPEWTIEELLRDIPKWAEIQAPEFSAPEPSEFEVKLSQAESKVQELIVTNEQLTTKLAEFSAGESALRSEIEAAKNENSVLSVKIKEYETGLRNAEFTAFVNKLVLEGKILPDQAKSEVEQLETLYTLTPVEFSAANGEVSPVEKYKVQLTSRPKIFSTEHIKNPEFSRTTEDDPVVVGRKARKYIDEQASKGVKISIEDAIKHVKSN